MTEYIASTSSSLVTFSFIQRNGGTILLRGGYEFYARRKHNSGLTVWACTQRKTCKGVIRIKDQNILHETAHSHAPDFAKNEIEESVQKLKTELYKPGFPNIPQKYNSMISQLKDAGMDIVSKIPKFTSVKSTLYRQRNSAAGVSKIVYKQALDVEVPPRYNDFLLADYQSNTNNTRIILFSSKEARLMVHNLKDCYGDGTFRSCPNPFIQLYTIHGDTGSTVNHTNIIPVVYALMSNRTTESYYILFSMIKSQLPDWNPAQFRCDYEKPAINAIAKVFPSVIVKGCYYHYNNAIFKKGKKLKMTMQTSQDPKEVRLVQLSAVLPLLPEHEIINGWVYIIARYGDSESSSCKQFIKYMERQWLCREFFKVWCVFGERHRPTNALEAWHGKLNKTIGTKKPNLMHFLHTLKEDSSLNVVRNILTQINKSLKRKRAKKYILKDDFIQEVQQELSEGLITVGHALEILRN